MNMYIKMNDAGYLPYVRTTNMTVRKSAKQLEKSQFGTFSTQIGICLMAITNQEIKMGGLFSKVNR